MLDTVRNYMVRHRMLSDGDLVIVSVSGGPDSVTLLHILHQLAPESAARLHVFHLDHGLRGETSAEEALYVRQLADRLGLPSTIVGLGPDVIRRLRGSVQATAREVRQAEVKALAHRIGASKVAVGHNRDDQAETVLMRLLRGAGTRGLAGIHPVRELQGLTYIRPLLDSPRSHIEAYCRQYELFPRQDESNLKPAYLRNRIRLELLPELARTYNPTVVAQLAQLADLVGTEDRFLETLVDAAWTRCRAPGEGVSLLGSVLLAEPLALARRVVRRAAREVTGQELDVGLAVVNQVLEAAARSHGTHTLTLPGGLLVRVEYGVCHFLRETPALEWPAQGEWPVALAGSTEIPELNLLIEAAVEGVPQGPFEAVFDADRLPGPLSVRFRRPGDRVWLVGMEGSKKLQDILVDAKVPQRVRDAIPLLVSGEEVIWMIGQRLDRRYLAWEDTAHKVFLRATFKPFWA